MTTRYSRASLRASSFGSSALFVLGAGVLLGWWLGIAQVTRPLGGIASMKANTAFCMVLLGGAIRQALPGGAARLRVALGLAVVAIASIVVVEHASGRSFGIDQLLAVDRTLGDLPKGRPSPVSAVALLLLGGALALGLEGWRLIVAEAFALLAAALALVAVSGYMLGVRALYAVDPYGSIAPETTLALLVASAAFLAAHPGQGLFAALTGETFASRLLRAGLPVMIGAPLLLGWVIVRAVGQRDEPVFALAVFSTVIVLLLVAVLTAIATALHRAELGERARARRHAEKELQAAEERERLLERITAVNVELEERVRDRTAELSGRLQERDVLLQEVHHRVNNNLQLITSLIDLQLDGIDDAKSRDALQVCQNRMAAIVLVNRSSHESADLSQVRFLDCARAIALQLLRALSGASDRIQLEAEGDLTVPLTKAIPCGLILNELVSNAVVHAFPDGRRGKIRITLGVVGEGEAELVVADDGVGMAPTTTGAGAEALGLVIVRTLAKQLDGRLELEPGPGTTVRLGFPLASTVRRKAT